MPPDGTYLNAPAPSGFSSSCGYSINYTVMGNYLSKELAPLGACASLWKDIMIIKRCLWPQ